MKRRTVLKSILVAPAAAALQAPALAQQASDELPKLAASATDAVAPAVVRFFTPDQLAALRRLAEILMPASGELPGAAEAGVAGFLDFLIGVSPADRQALYRGGLDRLNAEAQNRYGKPFAELSLAQAEPILSPLAAPWTYQGPPDLFARFLGAAKDDVMQATTNSREWADAASGRSRGAGGLGLYWHFIE